MTGAQVGDVVRVRFRWGRRPTSVHHKCPRCRGFLKRGATTCRCGVSFDYIAEDFAQVTGLASP